MRLHGKTAIVTGAASGIGFATAALFVAEGANVIAVDLGGDIVHLWSGTLPQTAAAPTWTGGAIRLSIPATVAFPESCCYQLELRAYKRTIVNCQANNAHRNLSERSFQVTV